LEKPTWHLIGHLQTNKAKRACSLFDHIHSVSSVPLAKEISRRAETMDSRASCLLEVNVAGEESKQGFSPLEMERATPEIATLPMIEWLGLMTVAPLAEPDSNRSFFRQLAQLKDVLAASFADHPWSQLSMGMTNDFDVAVEEGATDVRIGRAIFGARAS
jgi:pyridoxal phosphate enzyme (YggS family)